MHSSFLPWRYFPHGIIALLLILGSSAPSLQAQPILPSSDGTGTIVTPDNDRFDISGGSLSENDQNLFHSFDQFGLNPGQVANFLANPNIQNILSRVVGGDVSIIDGLLKVTGGTPNLYLMNPAGIIFGNGARLDVSASFTATTATGMEFNDGIFSAFHDNDYRLLIGDPSSLVFAILQPGSIVNAGILTVPDLSTLTLAAGQILNLGTLRGGAITITALPGTSTLRLTPNGSVLSLDLSLPDHISIENFNPTKLPDLLLGTELEQATNLDLREDGSVWLVPPEVPEISEESNNPTTIASSIVGSTVEIFATGKVSGQGELESDRLNLTARQLGEVDNPLLLKVNNLTTDTILANGNQFLQTIQGVNNLNLKTSEIGLISLTVAGELLDSDSDLDVQSQSLTLDTTAGIGTIASPLQTAVSRIAAQVRDQGDIFIQNQGNLTVQQLESLSGIKTPTGAIGLEVMEGRLTLNSDTPSQSAIQTENQGDISLKANEILLNSNIDSAGNQTYQGSILLGTNTRLISTKKGNILVQGTIDSVSHESPRNLSIETGGLTQFNGAIGSQNPLASLETDGQEIDGQAISGQAISGQAISGERTDINTNLIQTIDRQFFGDPVKVSQSTQLIGKEIGFAQTLDSSLDANSNPDSTTDSSINLNITADRFIAQGSIGTQNPFSTITIETSNNLEINGNLLSLSDIKLTSQDGFIQTRQIQTNGGTVNLETLGLVTPITSQQGLQTGDIQVSAIQTSGGSVNIIAKRFFRALGTINRSSISTVGSDSRDSGNGAIRIVHSGQSFNQPFIVGDPHRSNNGVAGYLRTNLATLPGIQAFPGSVIGGNIQILAGENNPPINTQFIAPQVGNSLTGFANNTETALETIEDINALEFQNAFGRDPVRQATPQEVQKLLRSINNDNLHTENSEKFAAIYLYYNRANYHTESPSEHSKDTIFSRGRILRPDDPPLEEDSLSLLVVTEQEIKQIEIPDTVTRSRVSQSIQLLRDRLMDPSNNRGYKPFAAQLYDWIAKPITEALQDTPVNNLMFVLGRGLRSLPVAALYNRRTSQFLIEEYGLALVPSISYLDDTSVSLNQIQTLAMGASNFANNDNFPLPAVPLELDLVRKTRPTQVLQNEQFTFENLQNLLQQHQQAFSDRPLIMHLATHADFGEISVPDLSHLRSNPSHDWSNLSNSFSSSNPFNEFTDGKVRNISYLQFFDRKLRFDELQNLKLDQMGDIELFVISACNTATGNDNAELGFAGLSIQLGAQSALASLWQVSDLGTMILMGEFYNQLNNNISRTQALRQAQLAMLRGEVGRIESNQLTLSNRSISISPELSQQILSNTPNPNQINLSHPFYWSAFTLIGSPW